MNPTTIIALGSIIALALPLTILLVSGLSNYRSFRALTIYYAIMILDNCIGEGFLPATKEFSHISAVTSNLLDPILMLLFITHFSRTAIARKQLLILTLSIALFEIAAVTLIGYNDDGLAVALGPGLATVAGLSILFFSHQGKLSISKGKAIGKAVIVAGLTFMYGSYFISYLMYFVFKNPDIAGSYLVLYFINILSSFTIAIGIFLEKYRVHQVQELLMVRKEIASIYAPVLHTPDSRKQNQLVLFIKNIRNKNNWKAFFSELFYLRKENHG